MNHDPVILVQKYSQAHISRITSVDVAEQRSLAFTASTDNSIGIIDLREGRLFGSMSPQDELVTTVHVNRNLSHHRERVSFLSGTHDGRVFSWEVDL